MTLNFDLTCIFKEAEVLKKCNLPCDPRIFLYCFSTISDTIFPLLQSENLDSIPKGTIFPIKTLSSVVRAPVTKFSKFCLSTVCKFYLTLLPTSLSSTLICSRATCYSVLPTLLDALSFKGIWVNNTWLSSCWPSF